MKNYLAKYWWIAGAVSVVLMALCPEVGIFALANLAVVVAAAYTLHLATQYSIRQEQARSLKKKMTRKERQSLETLESREAGSIRSLCRLMPYLCFGVVLLDGYTFYYYSTAAKSVSIFPMTLSTPVSAIILAAGMAAGILFYFAWCLKMNTLMNPR